MAPFLRFALDLVEVYFQVMHARLPFLNPTHFRARLNVPQYASVYVDNASGASAEEPLHPALMATVIAWGAKFSEHPLLVADRLNSSTRQSGLAKTLIVRAREIAEALKVHRVPAAEHVVIALLIEPLQSRAFPSVPFFFVAPFVAAAVLTCSPFASGCQRYQMTRVVSEKRSVFEAAPHTEPFIHHRFPRFLAQFCYSTTI
jgi:hypothetical protein